MDMRNYISTLPYIRELDIAALCDKLTMGEG